MSFRKEIEQALEQIQEMQEQFRQVRDQEILPLSFFSTSYDVLKSLTLCLHEMEAVQVNKMQEHLSMHKTMMSEVALRTEMPLVKPVQAPVEPAVEPAFEVAAKPVVEPITEPVKPEVPVSGKSPSAFLGDAISKSLFNDLRKALSLNDRFRYQRDLFGGNADLMNDTLEQLNAYISLNQAIDYLDDKFHWHWENETAMDFKELLEKRFS